MFPDGEGVLPLLATRASADAGRLFATVEDTAVTIGDLDRISSALAAGMARMGIARDARVAVMLRNSLAALVTPFGLAKAGAVWVPVHAQSRGEGLRCILEHAAPRLVIAEADLVPAIRDCGADLADTPVVVPDDPSGCGAPQGLFGRAARDADPRAVDHRRPAGDAPFAIMYTSGTSGPPKGAILTHQMLRLAGEAVALVAVPRPGDVFFVWEPLYHIGGAQLLVLPLIRNVTLAMVDRFSARRFWRQVRASGATHIHYLGGVLQLLLTQPPGPDDRDHGVRIAWGGGCPKQTWQSFEGRFGVEIRECYGMTEASSITTFTGTRAVGTVGRPVPWFQVEICDARGRPVAPGERGEIVVRSRRDGAIFPGYFRDPDATARALRDDALYTGDIGSFDGDGNLIFHGRLSDSVRCRGENVSAWEVEHVAAAHADVEACAMIGVATEVGEQDIKLFVQLKPGARVDEAGLSAWLDARLASYQRPRYIAFVRAFERTPSQRIKKHRLSRETASCWDRVAQERQGS